MLITARSIGLSSAAPAAAKRRQHSCNMKCGQSNAHGPARQPSTHTPLAVQVQGSADAAAGDGDLFVGGPADATTDGMVEWPTSGRVGRPRA